jgi:energy-converting hydrogenase Eha subunit A
MNHAMRKLIGLVLTAVLLGLPALAQQQPSSTSQSQTQSQQPIEAPVPGQPTMPPINRNELPENPAPAPSNQVSPNPPPQTPAPQVQAPSEPTGTAAAEAEQPGGSAASKPAGAAIAPAKQRQVRSLLIKVGFIAGAAVALGTVYALSAASPGRVPHSTPSTTTR